MIPSLIFLHPELARAALQYRIDRVAGARAKAASQGYAGIMWPCESAYSGYEVQGTAGGYKNEGFFGTLEQHFSSDVSFAAWEYWQTTQDPEHLRDVVEPMLRGVAEFWASRVSVRKRTSAAAEGAAPSATGAVVYEINGVMGPVCLTTLSHCTPPTFRPRTCSRTPIGCVTPS